MSERSEHGENPPIPTVWAAASGWAPAAAASGTTAANTDIDVFRMLIPEQLETGDWLSEEDRERVARLTHAAQQQRFIAGRTALRALLSRVIGCTPGEVPLSTGAHGKPEVPDAVSRGIAFNLSHTEHCVLVALAAVERIGIDVEPVREGLDFERLARRVLAASEREALPVDEAARRQLFYRLWCAKEAYLKAWGTGLSFGPARCQMAISPGTPVSLVASEMANEEPGRWQFVELDAGEDLKACVCWPGAACEVRCWQLEPELLPEFAEASP